MLGDMICKLRKEAGYSQEYLSSLINVSASAIGMYEQNRRLPGIETLISMCKIFHVSSDYLLEISNSRAPYAIPKENSEISVPQRLHNLINEYGISIQVLSGSTKIQCQRLENIINNMKLPNITEVILFSEYFSVTSDYILCLTSVREEKTQKRVAENSFPSRLRDFIFDGYTEMEIANGLDISIATLRALLNGDENPTPTLLCKMSTFFKKSTDFLLGLTNSSREAYPNGTYPFKIDSKSIERIQAQLGEDNNYWMCNELGLTEDEFFSFYHYGFIPHIDVIYKLCASKSISADYILNLSDSKSNIKITKEFNEEELLKNFRLLGQLYKNNVNGFISEQLLQQQRDEYMKTSVAADSSTKKTGTNDPK